jgi:hypothetical protein
MQMIKLNPFNMTLKQVIQYVPNCAVAQGVSHLSHTSGFCHHLLAGPFGVCGGQRELGQIFV